MNSNAGLDRCHLPRSLIVALLDHENLYYSINAPLIMMTFPCSASGKPIPQRKNSFTTTLSRPELLISTNITHPPPFPQREKSFPRSIHSTHPIPSLRKTTNSVHWTKRLCEYTKAIAVHPTSNLSFSRRGHVSSCCKINSTPATDTVN